METRILPGDLARTAAARLGVVVESFLVPILGQWRVRMGPLSGAATPCRFCNAENTSAPPFATDPGCVTFAHRVTASWASTKA